MKTIYTLEQAVMEFGDTKKIAEFEKSKASSKKGKGNLNKRTFESLLKTIQQHYKVVEIEGRGANRTITCEGKYEVVQERQTNYSNSGNRNQLPYKDDIREAVIKYLHKHQNDNRATITTKRLAYELGCFSEIMYQASRKIGREEREEYFNKCAEEDSRIASMGYDTFYECVKEVDRLTRQLNNVLDELKENNIIYYQEVYQTVIVTDDEREIYDKQLTLDEIIKVKHHQMKLRKKHAVTHQDIMYGMDEEVVKAYKKDELQFFKYMGFNRLFKTNVITLVAYDEEIEDYFSRKPLTDKFRLKHVDFAVKLAEKRQDAFHNKPIVVRNNHQLQKEIGGKLKSDVYKETSTAKDMIVGEYAITVLENDEILQSKLSNIYADTIENGLKTLQIEGEETA